MSNYINHNGVISESDKPVLYVNNRGFRYGDALFETIRFSNNKPLFLKEHLQRLINGMRVLKMEMHPLFSEAFFEKNIFELIQKNGIGTDGRIRVTVYRNDGGFYAPSDNKVSFLIEAYPKEEVGYVLNQKGLTVDLYTEFRKTPNALASIKSANSSIYVMAGIYKNQHQLDECILSNDKGHIIEAISSNIFAVKNGVLYTSPVEDGCVDGVMRKKIIQIAQQNKIAVYEISIMQNVLLGADELFLTNTIKGIQWVVAFKQKRYFNNTSKKLIEKLNELVLSC
ncbi:MAG: aminotransferase class IV family protein [Bacteroidetes bacterium]|jgi:branched-subunit amino acid aminotransferase/4-amino-4-deoxychorismate lyase|nr:aminotransferase class IV family protein [Bacteroidota bacterium]